MAGIRGNCVAQRRLVDRMKVVQGTPARAGNTAEDHGPTPSPMELSLPLQVQCTDTQAGSMLPRAVQGGRGWGRERET